MTPEPQVPSLTGKPEWYHGLTLEERIASLGAINGASVDPAKGKDRLKRWRSQAPFDQDGWLDRRLAEIGGDLDAFRRVLGEPADDLAQRHRHARPAWLESIDRAYARPTLPKPLSYPQTGSKPGWLPFLHLAEPLVRDGLERLESGIEELTANNLEPPFGSSFPRTIFLNHLTSRLRSCLTRVLVVELQIARLEKRLQGDTSAEQLADFHRQIREPETALEILERYPVLGRRLVWEVDAATDFVLDFLRHVVEDLPRLVSSWAAGGELGKLLEATTGAGDSHRGGRSVIRVRFESDLRLIYKPRPMAVEVAFQRLLRWTNDRGIEPQLSTLRVIDCGDHGWVEQVEPGPCADEVQVERFFQRQGIQLALLHLLEATDFHRDNLLAAGEHPVLVDLETLFHPSVLGRDAERPEQPAGFAVEGSLLRVGLLPQRVWSSREQQGVDISGLGSRSEQAASISTIRLTDSGTADMRFESVNTTLPSAHNQPVLNGSEVPPSDWSHSIEAGFRAAWDLLVDHRNELLSAESPLNEFFGAEVRVVLRPTRSYEKLLSDGSHPHALSSGLELDRTLDRLWRPVVRRPILGYVIDAEQRDLRRGDIPYFTTRPDSRHLWSSQGEVFENVFETSGLERVRSRIGGLSKTDLERHVWTLRSSLVPLASAVGERPHASYSAKPAPVSSPERLLSAARTAGERLATLTFEEDREEGRAAKWLTFRGFSDGRWSFVPAGPDLYNGLSGIALFLGHLGALTGESRFTKLARSALVTQRRQIDCLPERVTGIGGFTGWGGVLYGLTQLGTLWQDESLLDEAETYVTLLQPKIADDQNLDVLSGSAGCLLSLLALYRLRPSDTVADIAIACGEHLLKTAEPMEQGVGWVVPRAGSRPLAGFSHGVAGIALALLRLVAVTDDPRYRDTAWKALAYERSLFSKDAGNWPDLRENRETDFMTAWCHGAPGIGLARLAGLPHLDDPQIRREIDLAVETTRAYGLGRNHSLCHGDLGNLELLLEAAKALDRPELRTETLTLTGELLASIEENGWLYGAPLGTEPLGLMLGLAGIGYGLLRLAAPQRLPNVLTLESPRPRAMERSKNRRGDDYLGTTEGEEK